MTRWWMSAWLCISMGSTAMAAGPGGPSSAKPVTNAAHPAAPAAAKPFNPFLALKAAHHPGAAQGAPAAHGAPSSHAAEGASVVKHETPSDISRALHDSAAMGKQKHAALETARREVSEAEESVRTQERSVDSARSSLRSIEGELGRLRGELASAKSNRSALASAKKKAPKAKAKDKETSDKGESHHSPSIMIVEHGAEPEHESRGMFFSFFDMLGMGEPAASPAESKAHRAELAKLDAEIERIESSISAKRGAVDGARRDLSDAENKLARLRGNVSSAQARVTAAEDAHAEWQKSDQGLRVMQVRVAIKSSRETGMPTGKGSAKYGVRVFSTQKAISNDPSENRDAASVLEHGDGLRLAVSDGSSVGQLTGEWANLIAHGFTGQLHASDDAMPKTGELPALGDKDALRSWLTPFHDKWSSLAQAAGPFAQRAITLNGGMATLVGMDIKRGSDGKFAYHASAAGDSNMFILRGGKLIKSWPMAKAGDFDSSPLALSFLLDKNPGHAWMSSTGTLEAGDQVFMVTDAMAKWVLEGGGKKAPARLEQLAQLKTQAQFQSLVDKARKADMGDDDTTLAHFVVPAADAAPAKAAKKAPKAAAKDKE